MARRIFLHVGTTKSGTTFLQRVLWGHREQLLDAGLLLPGEWGPDHYAAALDVREEPFRSATPDVVAGAWSRLVDAMAGWDGDALVTHELFAPATAEQAARAIASLEGAEVHVVVTARDLARQVPSEWQEHLKHRSVLTFPEFVREVRTGLPGPFSPNGYHFWDQQDLGGLLVRWGQVPAGQVHLVTVPPAGAGQELLWDRFTSVLGISPQGFDLTVGRTNTSLRGEQAELVRRLNTALESRLPLPGPYTGVVKTLLAHRVLAGRPGTSFALTSEDHEYAVEQAHRIVADVQARAPHVVGDLADLIPGEQPPAGTSGDASVAPDAVLDEAVEALAAVLDKLADERARNRRLRARVGKGPGAGA
jgi:hypothetical protein